MYYSALVFGSGYFRVHETAPVSYRRKSALSDWTDEELNRVRLVLKRITELRVANREDAEDLVQETLLTMAARCPDVAIEKGLLVWAMGVLRNKVGNYYRRVWQPCPTQRSLAGLPSGGAAACESPEAIVHYAELRALVNGILDGFPQRERLPLAMLLEEMPTSEIAARMHPELYQNVVNRLHRGRRKLAFQLAQFGYGDVHASRRQPLRRRSVRAPAS